MLQICLDVCTSSAGEKKDCGCRTMFHFGCCRLGRWLCDDVTGWNLMTWMNWIDLAQPKAYHTRGIRVQAKKEVRLCFVHMLYLETVSTVRERRHPWEQSPQCLF